MAGEKRKEIVFDFITYKNMLEKARADNAEDEKKYRAELQEVALKEGTVNAEMKTLQKAYAHAYSAGDKNGRMEIGLAMQRVQKHDLVRLELRRETLQQKLDEIAASNTRIREREERSQAEAAMMTADCNKRLKRDP